MTIRHTHMNSSHIQTVGYNSENRTLQVSFHSGKKYTYHDVPPETHEALMTASSPGQFLHQKIKNNHKFTS